VPTGLADILITGRNTVILNIVDRASSQRATGRPSPSAKRGNLRREKKGVTVAKVIEFYIPKNFRKM
jgi:hypothetical protein